MAQLKAGSTVGGNTIAVDSPAVVPGNGLTVSGTKDFANYIAVKDGQLLYVKVTELQTGFTSSGGNPAVVSTIDKFPFSAPFTTATSAGTLSPARIYGAGQSSSTEGFTSGGENGSPASQISSITKFPFTAPFTTTTAAGSLSQARSGVTGQSSSTEGFTSGGYFDNLIVPSITVYNTIDKFPFSSPFTTASSAGTLSQSRGIAAGQSSSTEGFTSGGSTGPAAAAATIDKFPFTAPFTTASSAGSLSQSRSALTGQSSSTEGFSSGGFSPASGRVTTIDKFPFSAPFTTASSAGALSQARNYLTGQSSSTDGYAAGGTPGAGLTTLIDRFPFTAPFTTATNVGSLSQSRVGAAGQQF